MGKAADKIKSWFKKEHAPPTPTAADLNSAPAAQWYNGGTQTYDPNNPASAQNTGPAPSSDWHSYLTDREQRQLADLQQRNDARAASYAQLADRVRAAANGRPDPTLIQDVQAAGVHVPGTLYGASPQDWLNFATTVQQAGATGNSVQERQITRRAKDAMDTAQTQYRQQQNPFAMSRVQGDQQGIGAARGALQQLQGISQQGWTPLDRIAMDQAQRQSNMGERSQRDALMQHANMQGQRMGGMGFGSALQAQQSGADRSADYATNIALAGRQRSMDAMGQAANLGMGLDQQAFGQAAQRASAVDAGNMWMTGKKDQAAADAYGAAMNQYQINLQQQNNRLANMIGVGTTSANMISNWTGGGRNGGGNGGG